MNFCPKCNSAVGAESVCSACGERLTPQNTQSAPCQQISVQPAGTRPRSTFAVSPQSPSTLGRNSYQINRRIAGILAILLGGFGGQYLYLRLHGRFVLSLIGAATFMPIVFGILQGIRILCLTDDEFKEIYLGYAPAEVAKDPTTIYL